MSTWLETTRRIQNGEPVLRRIKTPSFTDDIWFTDRGYAEVDDENIADHLATKSEDIRKVAAPDNPGDYYGSVGDGVEMTLALDDGYFDVVTAQEGHIDNLSTDVFEPDLFSPTEVGTSANPVPSGYIESFGTEEIDNDGATYSTEIQYSSDPDWFRIGTIGGPNSTVHCFINETSRTGGGDGEPGYEILHYRIGNDMSVFSGKHIEFGDPDDRVRESTAKIVYDATADEHYLYYKPGEFQTADIHVYPDSQSKNQFDFEWVNVGLTEPTGDDEYILDRHFDIVADRVKTDADVQIGGSLTTTGVNADRSFRTGQTVYYNPANPGPYIDGSDAFADVPPGGQFIIAAGTDYDVAVEGRLVMADGEGKTIRGEGWTADPDLNVSGSQIINSGSDVIDSPVIEFNATEREERGIAIYDLSIVHEGAASPAIYLNNTMRNIISDCKLNMGLVGHKGIETDGKSFFTRIYRTNITRFTNYGLHLKGGGGGGGIVDCHVASSATDSVATRVERDGIRISGGQHSSDGAGISFYNTSDVATRRGSFVDGHIWFEKCTDAIRVDGDTNSYNDVVIVNPRTTLDPDQMGVQNLVNLGRANNVHVLYPNIFRTTSGGNLATLGPNCMRPKFVGDYSNVGVPPIVDNGASLPAQIIHDCVTDSYLSNIDTTIPTWVALRRASSGEWSPAFNDGTDWYEQSSANSTFIP